MTDDKIALLNKVNSSKLIKPTTLTDSIEIDMYLLPYTKEEFENLNNIPERTLEEAQTLKIQHLKDVYLKTVQLLFSALVITHKKDPNFKINSKLYNAAKTSTLLPEYMKTLKNIFGDDKPTSIWDRFSQTKYSTLEEVFDLEKTFFNHEPGSGQGKGFDMIYSGWYYGFNKDKKGTVNIQFDPWFKKLDNIITNSLWQYFGTKFPEVPNAEVRGLKDAALESRMAAYIGINTINNNEFIKTAINTYTQDYELHTTNQGSLLRYNIIGTRKQAYPKDIPKNTLLQISNK